MIPRNDRCLVAEEEGRRLFGGASMKVQEGKTGALSAAQQAGKDAPLTRAGGRAPAEGAAFAKLLEGAPSAEAEVSARAGEARGAEREAAGVVIEVIEGAAEQSAQTQERREVGGHEQARAGLRRAEGEELQQSADQRVERAESPAQSLHIAQPQPHTPASREQAPAARGDLAGEGAQVAGAGEVRSGEQVKEAAPSADTARAEEVRQLAERLVEACETGIDQQGRQVMMLDVQVPGRGGVRVRLRKQGDGVEVRLRADNAALGELLRARQGTLRDGMSERGITLSRLEVVG
jgi:hypothetical protein